MAHPTIQELYDLTGKVALVTGAARNLGRDMASALAESGADVAIADLNYEGAKQTAEEMAQETGRTIRAYALDVTNEDSVAAAVKAVLADFGRIDILVNNAGNVVGEPKLASLEERPLDGWLKTMDVNINGVFLMCKHVLAQAMIPAKSGAIINLGSISGMVGRDRSVYENCEMIPTAPDYGVAKAGVIQLTRDLAASHARYNIRVNCISPGGIERGQPEPFIRAYSKQTPMGRMGEGGIDLKGPVVFLASEAARYVTGVNLPVDGGFTAW